VPGRLTPAQLAGTRMTLEGVAVTVAGSGTSVAVNGNSAVVCSNVQTSKATSTSPVPIQPRRDREFAPGTSTLLRFPARLGHPLWPTDGAVLAAPPPPAARNT
jgi:hypothetical protein